MTIQGGREFKKLKFYRENMKLNWNSRGGGRGMDTLWSNTMSHKTISQYLNIASNFAQDWLSVFLEIFCDIQKRLPVSLKTASQRDKLV